MTEKKTRQRAAIIQVFRAEERPLTAAEIHRLARGTIPRLGLATVYRLIRRMLDEQELVGVDFPGQPTRYELPTRAMHSHFICTRCNKVFDLPDSATSSQFSIELPPGFQARGHEMIVFGLCPNCAEK